MKTKETMLQRVIKVSIWAVAGIFIVTLVLVVVGGTVGRKMSFEGRNMMNPLVTGEDSVDVVEENIRGGRMMDGGATRGMKGVAPSTMMGLSLAQDEYAQAPAEEKKIIKNGWFDIRVKNADDAMTNLQEIAKRFSGEVASSNISSYGKEEKSGTVVIKVPVGEFENVMRDVRNIATQVVNENTSGSDVTAQHIDLSARLKNKQAQEESLQALLGRAEKVGDVIDVTRELGTVRGEIESLEGQLRYLSSQTDMATISISFREDAKIVSGKPGLRPWEVVKEAIQTLLGNLGKLAMGAIVFVIVGLPLILVYGVLLYGIYKLVRKLMNRFFEEKK